MTNAESSTTQQGAANVYPPAPAGATYGQGYSASAPVAQLNENEQRRRVDPLSDDSGLRGGAGCCTWCLGILAGLIACHCLCGDDDE
ncbi:hypothetical protein H4R24_002539 [Coemansia sp. RSA 988]|nr:hypothetical protein H4R24_002539 [Coemansia sp. RSA 988]